MRRPGRSGPTGRDAIKAMAERLEALTDVLHETLSAGRAGAEGRDGRDEDRGAGTVDAGTVRAIADVQVRVDGLANHGAEAREATGEQEAAWRPGEASPRTPDHEIADDGINWRLTADLPGIAADQLALTLLDGEIRIETSGQRLYALSVTLPVNHDPASLSHELALGVLQVTLARRTDEERRE